MLKACSTRATPFELVTGVPHMYFGARVTFVVPSEPDDFLTAFGLAGHPWGIPAWVGLRVASAGLIAKCYHRLGHIPGMHFRSELMNRFQPVMISLHSGRQEYYLRMRGSASWEEFALECLAPLPAKPPQFSIIPRATDSSFCLSVQTRGEVIEAITLFADHRSLPDDDTIFRLWRAGMTSEDAAAYELAYAAIRSCGTRRLGSWHAMLSWTVDRSGEWRRAASLRFPALEDLDASAA